MTQSYLGMILRNNVILFEIAGLIQIASDNPVSLTVSVFLVTKLKNLKVKTCA